MDTPITLAFALEGEWRIEFEDVPHLDGTIMIENRTLRGRGPDSQPSGDLRVNDSTVTVCLRVRWETDSAAREALMQAQGRYHPTTLVALGSDIERPDQVVRIELTR